MNKFIKIFIFILLGILQLTLMPLLAIEGMIPNLILIISIVLIFCDYEEEAFYLAAIGGLILDLSGPFFFGFHAIFLIGIIFLIRLLLQKIVTELNTLLVVMGVFIFSALFGVLENLFLGRLPQINVLICGLYSVVIGLAVFIYLHSWHKRAQVLI